MLAHLKKEDIYAKLTEKLFMAQMPFLLTKVVFYSTLRSDALKVGLAVFSTSPLGSKLIESMLYAEKL